MIVMKMASQKQVRYKILSVINLGGQEVRFLGVNEENNAVHFPKSVHLCPGRLLFLASDVLTASSISKKNHIRVHTRYAKNGYATKLRLSGFKIEGINNSGIMWFYSIQGLFKVVFELQNPDMQRDCLTLLQSVWMSRYAEPPLEAEGILRYNMRLKMVMDSSGTVTQDTVKTEISDTPVEHFDDAESAIFKRNRVVVITEEVSAMLEAASYLDRIEQDRNLQQSQESEDELEDEGGKNCGIGAGEFVEQLVAFVQTSISNVNDISHQVISQILLTLDYLKHITSLEEREGENLQWGSAFFSMMEDFLNLVKWDSTDLSFTSGTFGLPVERYILLHVVSEWLGKEFNKLESQVALKVDSFKKQNLDCIRNLPSPETLVNTLFPLCMKTLIVNWLGSEKDTDSPVSSDHNYTPPPKIPRTIDHGAPNYQLIQLILEFTSNCLISGIAHVVYSRINLEKSAVM